MSTRPRRWSLFVDGENLTIEVEKLASEKGLSLPATDWHRPAVFLWRPGDLGSLSRANFGIDRLPMESHAVRAYYYTTVAGSEETVTDVTDRLWRLGFEPRVFRKLKGRRRKAVDIALATDMLHGAYDDHYDLAVLVAGDGDYCPLVEAVKRTGRAVYLWYLDRPALSPKLKRTCDAFEGFDRYLDEAWKAASGLPTGSGAA